MTSGNTALPGAGSLPRRHHTAGNIPGAGARVGHLAFVRENLVRPGRRRRAADADHGHHLEQTTQASLAEAKLTPSCAASWQLKSATSPPGGSTGAYHLLPELMETIAELG